MSMPPLSRVITQALARHRFSPRRISVDGNEEGRVAIRVTAAWLEEAAGSERPKGVSRVRDFFAKVAMVTIAEALREEAQR